MPAFETKSVSPMHYLSTLSLADPPQNSPIAGGVSWVQTVMLGTTATIVAVIAVAAVGLLMLSGRLELRRGITVVLGCFILFGASEIAAAITGLAGPGTQPHREPAPDIGTRTSPLQAPVLPPSAYDPYAGASVPAVRQP
ncbi:TrbC/VirB2 family protein [Sphingopyxis alaskensis]|uniref:TrbC/VirB2 family protein n=1 Tax=Sphingopyxis alaskensis TaxID=117207 RepID=UPI0039194791